AALKLLLSGRAVTGDTGRKLGLIDVIEADDLLKTAVAHARRIAESAGELRRSSTRRDRLGQGTAFLESVAQHRTAANASPLDAPIRMIECIEAALLLPYDIGRSMEQAVYSDLVSSEHSKSLRHIFAAERNLQAASKWEGSVSSRTLSAVTVVGARGIGAEVAVQCLDAGFNVTVAEVTEGALEEGVGRIIGHFDARVTAGSMSEDAVEQVLDRMHAVSGYDKVAEADIVIDPSPALTKVRVAALDATMKAGAVLLLGSESVELGTVAEMTSRTSDVVGMRFFPGIKKNRLVELAAIDNTSQKAIATARALARKLDRLIVETAPGKDGIGTHIMEALHAAADLCLEDGARIAQIDAALKDWGLPFGSFAWRDILGIKRYSAPRGIEGQRGGGIDSVLVAVGRLGISTGQGYYTYQQRGRPGVPDPEVEKMVEADRVAKQVKLRGLSDGEVRARCVAAMAGAGAHLLVEGIAKRPADIDMVALHGLGFARRTGGVMFAADLMGLDHVHKLLTEMAGESPRISPPPAMMQDLLNSGQGLSGLNG
ncbi:3-hydroxyacyl-CoA dehydrogenase NAD-binding domain-containing protein, partial [bacterium]|nr:3-hydroxyacyl-CoA dehydrogenase NAD-binding domain-containing protein [bacterium]